MVFQFRASHFGAEKFHSAVVPHQGTDSRIFRGSGVTEVERILGPASAVRAPRPRHESLSCGTTDDEIDVRFREIPSFIKLIRTPDTLPEGATNTRETYLDVHRHIVITAERIDVDGNQLSVYDSLGGKSGGETQELIAIIVGAALRYQLGDEENSTRPRFAPVLLDEGFIKADAKFAGCAVGA